MQSSFFEFLRGFKPGAKPLAVLSSDYKEALKLKNIADYYGYEIFVAPDFRAVLGDDLRSFTEEIKELFTIIDAFLHSAKHKKIFISPYKSLSRPLPDPKYMRGFELNFAQKVNIAA